MDTFANLKTTIADYLARDDLTSNIPDFITLAESRMNKELRIREMMKRSTTTTTASDDTNLLPTGFLEARDIFIDGNPKTPLMYVTPGHYSAIYGGSETGKPKVFTVIGSEMRLGPSPDAVYTVEMLYYGRITALSDSATSNDILTNYPDLYLYGSLIEAEPFLQNDQRVQTWLALYGNAASAVKVSDEQATYTGGTLQMRTLYGD